MSAGGCGQYCGCVDHRQRSDPDDAERVLGPGRKQQPGPRHEGQGEEQCGQEVLSE